MTAPGTQIRLLKLGDAEALAAHLDRDAAALARWQPSRPPESCTPAGQRSSIERMLKWHESGEAWPGVVLANGAVIGASQHVLRSNGFRPFGIARSHVFIDGMWRDEIWWERLLD